MSSWREGRGAHKPESKPCSPIKDVSLSGRQGYEKEDAVAVWFVSWNTKVIVSPISAVIVDGENVSEPGPPTTTW